MYDILQLNEMLVPELKTIAEDLDIPKFKGLNKQDLIYKILDSQAVSDKLPKQNQEKEAKENASDVEESSKEHHQNRKRSPIKREDKETSNKSEETPTSEEVQTEKTTTPKKDSESNHPRKNINRDRD